MNWLKTNFSNLEEDADQQTIEHFACAYMLLLLGSRIMSDKASTSIHGKHLPLLLHLEHVSQYVWGLACLAMLYQDLCCALRSDTKGG